MIAFNERKTKPQRSKFSVAVLMGGATIGGIFLMPGVLLPVLAQQTTRPPPIEAAGGSIFRGRDPQNFDATVKTYRDRELSPIKIKGRFTVVTGGDIIETVPIAKLADPSVKAVFDIVRGADVATANMESNIRDYDTAINGIGGLSGPKDIAQDIKDQGWTIVQRAGNHVMDPIPDVLFETNKLLRKAGVEVAGSGRNLQEARAARFVTTPKGRVGLVGSFASPVASHSGALNPYSSESDSAADQPASYQLGFRGGRPGVDPIRLTEYNLVTPDELASLRKVADSENAYRRAENGGDGAPTSGPNAPLNLNGAWYTTGPNGEHGFPSFTMYPDDLKQIMRSIRDGKEQSDFMMLQVHAHPTTGVGGALAMPPDYLVEYAHDAIDNGADTFVATGPHQIGGIEIYKGKPIFYGLASIVYNILNTPVGYDRYRDNGLDPFETDLTDEELNWAGWPPFNIFLHKDRSHVVSAESILPKSIYQDGKLVEIDITPIHFGYGAPMSQLGIPHVATGEVAQRILTRLQALSKPYGTKIDIKGDIGVIKVSSDGKSP